MKRILVIDDETMILEVVKSIIEPMGYEVRTTNDPQEGQQRAIEEKFDLVVVDLRMPLYNGAQIVLTIKQAHPDQQIVVATGYPGDPLAQEALDAGAAALLKKPFEIAKLLEFLEE